MILNQIKQTLWAKTDFYLKEKAKKQTKSLQ